MPAMVAKPWPSQMEEGGKAYINEFSELVLSFKGTVLGSRTKRDIDDFLDVFVLTRFSLWLISQA
jgi:hypothetical protein